MKKNQSNWLILLLLLLAPFFSAACGTTYSTPPPEYPSGELEGSRYETMRVLSERLVQRLEALRDELRATRNTRAETPLFADLVERARRFRDRMSDYSNPARYVRTDVDELDRLARDYDYQTRDVSASTRAVEDWKGVQDVIDRMRRLLAGESVDVPPATGGTYPTYPSSPTYPTSPTYGGILTGSALEDFRRNVHEVVVRASLARDTVERAGAGYTDAERRLSADLSYFVSGARDLESRASASTVDRRDVRPYVERLSEDARRIDSTVRSSSTYSRAQGDWAEVMRLLQRLMDLSR